MNMVDAIPLILTIGNFHLGKGTNLYENGERMGKYFERGCSNF